MAKKEKKNRIEKVESAKLELDKGGEVEVKVGQIWLSGKNDYHGCYARRITEIAKEYYKKKHYWLRLYYEYWTPSGWIEALGEYSNGESYRSTISTSYITGRSYWLWDGANFEDVVAYSSAVLSGENPVPTFAIPDSVLALHKAPSSDKSRIGTSEDFDNSDHVGTALMGSASKEIYVTARDDLNDAQSKALQFKASMRIAEQAIKDKLDIMKSELDRQISIMSKEIEKLQRVIDTIELYLGVHEDIVQIAEGRKAPEETPISFRQMVLFMDEEIVLQEFDADYTNISDFDSWVVQDGNYKAFVPEEKCVAVFKPRRTDKYYSSNSFVNSMMNIPNHATYFLIRNGENIYRIHSDKFAMGNRLFPLRSELEQLGKGLKADGSGEGLTAKEIHTYRRIGFVLQGLIDRTEIFRPMPTGIKVFEFNKWDKYINFVYDDEATLPTGRISYKEWVLKNKATISEGNRVVWMGGGSYKYRKGGRFLRDYNEYNIPSWPNQGLYTLFKSKSIYESMNDVDCIKYNPKDEISQGWGSYRWEERKNDLTFLVDIKDDTILNYDDISLEDVEFYLYSRVDRKSYWSMIPSLLKIKELKAQEREGEKDFVELVAAKAGVFDLGEVWKALEWWKTKVKWKRAITVDDAKAFRMVVKKLKNK